MVFFLQVPPPQIQEQSVEPGSRKTESFITPGVDRRILVNLDEDENLHHFCNGRLEMRFRHKSTPTTVMVAVGSAFMSSEYCAITCGHNLFLPKEIQDAYPDFEPLADSVRFMPGLHGNDIKFNVTAKSFHITPEWITSNGQDDANDFALLYFDNLFPDEDTSAPLPLGRHVGFVRLAALEDTELTDKEVYVTGYPGEKGGFMYTQKGRVMKFSPSLLWHDIDTTSGNSGSKIGWHDLSVPETIVIGIHTQGLDSSGFNSGVRLTKDKLDLIRHWKRTVMPPTTSGK